MKSSMLERARFEVSRHFIEYMGMVTVVSGASSSYGRGAHKRMIPHVDFVSVTTSFGSRCFSMTAMP
jgi:hypothetical protein